MIVTKIFTFAASVLIGNTNTCYCSHSADCFTCNSHFMISTQILVYAIFKTLSDSNVVVHLFFQKVLHSLTSACVILNFSVRGETAMIVFKTQNSTIKISKYLTKK